MVSFPQWTHSWLRDCWFIWVITMTSFDCVHLAQETYRWTKKLCFKYKPIIHHKVDSWLFIFCTTLRICEENGYHLKCLSSFDPIEHRRWTTWSLPLALKRKRLGKPPVQNWWHRSWSGKAHGPGLHGTWSKRRLAYNPSARWLWPPNRWKLAPGWLWWLILCKLKQLAWHAGAHRQSSPEVSNQLSFHFKKTIMFNSHLKMFHWFRPVGDWWPGQTGKSRWHRCPKPILVASLVLNHLGFIWIVIGIATWNFGPLSRRLPSGCDAAMVRKKAISIFPSAIWSYFFGTIATPRPYQMAPLQLMSLAPGIPEAVGVPAQWGHWAFLEPMFHIC